MVPAPPPAARTKLVDRRAHSRDRLGQVNRSVSNLWALSLSTSIVLAAGIALFFYPAIHWRVYTLSPHIADILPQLVIGLVALVFLETIYIIVKVRETNELVNFIMAVSTEAGLLETEYPKDALTGTLDRRALPDVLKRETTWVDRYRIPLSLVLIDIAGFRLVNERQGYLTGDLVLKDLAQTILSTVRQTDSALRYGADQFLCILPRTDLVGSEAFVQRVAKGCSKSLLLRDLRIDAGMAVYEAGDNINKTLSSAEHDMAGKKAVVEKPSSPLAQPVASTT